jgi:hypothetical protein
MKKKKKSNSLLIFDSIRKPTLPPNRKIGEGNKPAEKAHPAQRKIKHKKVATDN